MAPAAREVAFDQFFKPMILDAKKDVIYVDHLKRGLEELPEEVPDFFDWMDRRRREPAPKSFEVATARESDARFFGIDRPRHSPPAGPSRPRPSTPSARTSSQPRSEMKSSVQSNLINLTSQSGINRLDIWVSPQA